MPFKTVSQPGQGRGCREVKWFKGGVADKDAGVCRACIPLILPQVVS